MKNINYVKLKQKDSYAILSPNEITFVNNATKEDLKSVMEDIASNSDVEEKLHYPESTAIAIIPTYDCNLRCIYCYSQGGKTKEVIDLNDVHKALNYIKKQNNKARILNLYLVGGGEPLLYFDKVLKIYEQSLSLFNKVQVHVVTNGTFNKEILNWLIEVQANIRISYDSLGQANQRPAACGKDFTSVIKNNIRILLEKDLNPMIQCIITSNTVFKMKEIIDELVLLGVNIVKFEPCSISEVSRGEHDYNHLQKTLLII